MTPSHRKVLLTGFMGAGKSTVGRLLAPMLGWQFVDADTLLTDRCQATIAALFQAGEAGFREQEASVIADALLLSEVVVALGGGALESAETRRRIAEDHSALLVYLETPLRVALARCKAEPGAAVRPVLADPSAVEGRYRDRLPLYQSAHLTLQTEGYSPPEIAQTIASAISKGIVRGHKR